MRTPKSWVVLASGGEASLYEWVGSGELQLIDHWAAPDKPPGRLHDAPGRTFESGASGSMRHKVEPRHDPAQLAEDAFVQRVCELLAHAIGAGNAGELTLIAPPRFLGGLRKHMSEHLRAMVRSEIGKDLTKRPLDEILEHLRST